MNKEFIHYEQALALKELGFDEFCFGVWASGQLVIGYDISEYPKNVESLAPLYQQAFRWFREKYGYLSYIDMDNYSFYRFTIYKGKGISEAPYHTYEEAELACINKLIEIVKDGTKINT
jgi:hypothetical protein